MENTTGMTVEQWLGEDNQIGIDIWHRKYQHENETFEEWLDRVSNGDLELRQLIVEKKLLLGGRTLANRGIDNGASYFNCYSRGYVEDDYRDIMQTAMDIGLTFKGQGGQGLSLTKIRPKGTPVGTQYTSDGIVPFMKIFNEVTAGTSQGGSRKGALLMSIDARHKEAMDFIHIKSKDGIIEKANLSLEIDDEFMEAVEKYYKTGEVIVLHEKRNYSGHEVKYDVTPIEVFKAMVKNCYDWAEPGVIFTDRFRNYNLMEFVDDYQIETCNPCGEQPLIKGGACCLASINLSEFVIDPYTDNACFNYEAFEDTVRVGVRTLDKLIDENADRHPLEEQRNMSLKYRNIGLGVMGYATMLMKLGLKYGSPEALKKTSSIFEDMFFVALEYDIDLAKKLGCFPGWDRGVFYSGIVNAHPSPRNMDSSATMRNCSLLSIAPTGSLATMLGESGGCEPEFALSYTRRTVGMTDGEDTYYKVYCKAAREYMALHNCTEDELPDCFVSAYDIPWQDRIATQAIIQNHIDTAISSTVNLPHDISEDEVAQLYIEAWRLGCKGVTIFREGCKRMPILSSGKDKNENCKTETSDESNAGVLSISDADLKKIHDTIFNPTIDTLDTLPRGYIVDASDNLVGKKRKLITGCGSLHCEGFFDPITGKLMEVFLSKGSTGGCNNSLIGLSRMISLAARAGVEIESIVDQLESCGVCPSYAVRRATKHDTSLGSCCPMAVGRALKDMWHEMLDEIEDDSDASAEDETSDCSAQPANINNPASEKTMEWNTAATSATTARTASDSKPIHEPISSESICPECGNELMWSNGCVSCSNCGWSKCN